MSQDYLGKTLREARGKVGAWPLREKNAASLSYIRSFARILTKRSNPFTFWVTGHNFEL